MADTYYMANREFEAEVQNGTIQSLRYRADGDKTEYVLPGTGFGEAVLTYQLEQEEPVHWFMNRSAEYKDKEPVRSHLELDYQGKVQDEKQILSVENEIHLEAHRLDQIVRIKNISERPVRILDAAFLMAVNSEVNWGESAAKKVIGHPFISGHGSHSLITRCDGRGKYLLVMPYQGGKWEYFDQGVDLESKDKFGEGKSFLYVYEHSEYVASKAKEHGARLRQQSTMRCLCPEEEMKIGLTYEWVDGYEEARNAYMAYGIPDVMAVPGYTVCRGKEVRLCIRGNDSRFEVRPQHETKTECHLLQNTESRWIYALRFEQLGENQIRICYGENYYVNIDFFVTQSIQTMIQKRGAFIAAHQVKDPNLWYNGLLTEWNNETGVTLTPDCYDKIRGWRIYEVTCDDPGLSKPAFLSSKLAEYPVQEEVEALDYYIEHFVWGGLQCTETEDYPYAIYGIPDWYQNRNSKDAGCGGKEHLWRIYDYPHLILMYYNMYRVAEEYEQIHTRLSAMDYLKRAYHTAIALFTIPMQLEEWSAYETGLYNEVVIGDVIRSLRAEGCGKQADQLERHWLRKMKYFVLKSKDIFGSEYPFDTTGFESTHVFAKTALSMGEFKKREDRWNPPIPYVDAVRFLENQTDCNIACRGYLEPAYYWYGSDYRLNNYHYTLSYMSQMGGCSLLDYALYDAADPFPILRLAYGSLLSSWALMNCGDPEDGYGYWFPGKENDGAACGGFEPLPYGETWLEQPHTSGAWYYSCEIDLGYCGAIRGASMVLADDPIFGLIAYGGALQQEDLWMKLFCEDGIGRRFHVVRKQGKFHLSIDRARIAKKEPIRIRQDYSEYDIVIDTAGRKREGNYFTLTLEQNEENSYLLFVDGQKTAVIQRNEKLEQKVIITKEQMQIRLIKQEG